MNILSRLRIISISTILALMVLVPVFVWSFVEFRNAKDDNLLAGNISKEMFERFTAGDHYLLYRDERSNADWHLAKANTDRLIRQAGNRFKGNGYQNDLKELREEDDANARIFNRIVSNATSRHVPDDGNRGDELEHLLTNQLLVTATVIHNSVAAMQKSSALQLELAFNRLITVSAVLALGLLIAIPITLAFISGLVHRRLAALHAGAKLIAEGQLDYRFKVDGRDEFTTLAEAINGMTGKLQLVASQLQTELVVRKCAEEEILALNQSLERRVAERTRELRDNVALLKAIMDNTPNPIYVKDIDSHLLLANPATLRTISRGEEEAMGKTDREIFDDPAIGQTIMENDRRVMDGGVSQTVEELVPGPQGARVFLSIKTPYFDADGKTIGLVGISHDITERKAAEQALKSSQEQLNLFVEQAPISIAMLDRNMNYIATSRRWIDEYGRGHAELVGRNHYVVNPDLSDDWKQIHRHALEGEISRSDEDRWVQGDGSECWLRWAVHPWTDATGQIGGIIISAEDITAYKAAERTLRDADRRKDEFLAMLAHELRNPLAPIRNAAHVLGRLGLAEPRVQWVQDVIERQVTHLSRMVDDLLDISRIVRGKIVLHRETIEFAPLVREVVASASLLADPKGHQLVVRLPAQEIWLQGDPVRLSQVLLNLLDNAIKYTPERGLIEVDVRVEGDRCEITVRDNGMGIPARLLPRVFDLFQQDERTLDRAQGGLGIGLTLVQRLVAMHGGEVEAHSEGHGLGSTFTVRLPIAAGHSALPPRPQAAGRTAAAEARVLVVDDDQAVADSMAVLLDMEGYGVRVAHSGHEALALMPEFRPQVVMLDIGLKGMNGFETAERLRALPSGRHVYLLAVTGYADQDTRAKALASGCDHFMVKPIAASELCGVLAGRSTGGLH